MSDLALKSRELRSKRKHSISALICAFAALIETYAPPGLARLSCARLFVFCLYWHASPVHLHPHLRCCVFQTPRGHPDPPSGLLVTHSATRKHMRTRALTRIHLRARSATRRQTDGGSYLTRYPCAWKLTPCPLPRYWV